MRLTITILMAFVMCAESATVRLYFVDPMTNEKDTNAFYVTPIGTNVLSNGGVVGRGITTRYVPASNGYRTNTLAVGHYSITNRSLGSGVVIRVPESSSLYDYTNLLISGYNIFVTVTNGESGGTSGALTNNDSRLTLSLSNINLRASGSAGAKSLRAFDINNIEQFFVNDEGATFSGIQYSSPPDPNGGYAQVDNAGMISKTFDGSSLTNINGTEIRSGTVADARIDSTITRDSELAAGTLPINGVLATNLVEAHGAYSPQHFNLGKTPVMDGLMRSNLPIRMLVFGDTAFIPTTGIINAFTNMGIPVRGTGGKSTYTLGNYAYATAAGTTTYTAQEGTSNPYVLGTVGMANGSSITNIVALGQSQGIDTDRISVKHMKNTGFGTVGVYTNSYGGTPTLFQTIDNNTGSYTWFTTVYDLPARISNCVVSVRSTGTNFLLESAIGQWKTNGLSLRLDQYTGGNCGVNNFTESTTKSNMFRTLLTDCDVLIITDLGGGDYSYGTNLWSMVKENNLKLDVILATSVIQTNNGGYDSRETILNIGRTTPFVVVDTAAMLSPTNGTILDYLYGEVSHLNTIGHNYLGEKFVNALGWNSDNFRSVFKQPQTNYVFVPVSAWRNGASLLTISDLSTTLGTMGRTWGHYVAAGTYGGLGTIIYPGNEMGYRKNMYARMLVITTNAISYSMNINPHLYPLGTNLTSWSAASGDSGNYTLGNSGQTNVSYTEWVAIKPTVRGPWAGWISLGFGATSKAYASFILGAELRADPDNAWDNW